MTALPAQDLFSGRSRDWIWIPLVLTPSLLIAALFGWGNLLSTFVHPGWIGINHIAPGTDWMVFYGAVKLAVANKILLVANGDAFTAYLNRSFADLLSVPLEYRPWFYPPSFLLLLLPFAPMGFTASYVAFQVASAGLLAWALCSRADNQHLAPYVAAAVLIAPAASLNVVDGQCAFLVAGLMVSGIRLLGPRPLLGGALLGLLTFKPQFCLLLPFALLGLRQYRGMCAAAVAALALVAISAVVFGLDVWLWWVPRAIENLVSPDGKWAAYGRIWGQSVWACAMLLGVPDRWASMLQFTALAASAAATFAAFRSSLSPDKKLAVLLAATVLAAPHSGAYDATLLVIAAALWLVAHIQEPRFLDWLVGLGIWMVPLFSPAVYVAAGRFSPLLTMVLIGLILNDRRKTKWAAVRASPDAGESP